MDVMPEEWERMAAFLSLHDQAARLLDNLLDEGRSKVVPEAEWAALENLVEGRNRIAADLGLEVARL